MRKKYDGTSRRLLLGVLVILSTTGLSCEMASRKDSKAGVTTAQPVEAAMPTVTLPDGFSVDLEIAANDETRAQGLMYRESLAPGRGMLFVFKEPGFHPFWMKNTLIPLDMIWLAADGKVVHVHPNAPPCKAEPCPSYPPSGDASFVLELGGGQAAAHKVAPGAQLRIAGLERFIVR